MPITLATAPSTLSAATTAALIRSVGGLRSPALATATAQSIHMALQHPVYDLGAADILAGHGLDTAVLTAWRELVEHDAAPVATVEVPVGAGPDQFIVTNGPYAAGLAAAVARAEQLPHVVDSHFELRILRVPAIYAELVWLSTGTTTEDVLLPVAPAPAPLDPGQTYSAAGALAGLAQAAGNRDLRPRPANA